MAAVVSFEPRTDWRACPQPRALRLVEPCRQPHPRLARRPSRAVYQRRRVLAALAGLGLVLTVARAGAALGGSTLASSGRLPHVQQVVVRPGDSLWSIAQRAAPGHDPRPIVDALEAAHGSAALTPGEPISVPTP
jgi:hypothetical protein